MIGGLVRLGRFGLVVAAGALVADRLLARASAATRPDPIRSMVVVNAPIERTWAVLADIERQPTWMTDLKQVRLLTPPPLGVGTRAEGTVRILGISVPDPITITEFEPPHRFAIRHEGPVRGSGVLTLEANVDGTSTIVRWEESLVAPFLPHLAATLGRPVLGAVFQQDLHNLRARIES